MHSNCQLLTPVKLTPAPQLSDSYMKEYSPALKPLTPRPRQVQLELLESPMPTQRDLFSQLISTTTKTNNNQPCPLPEPMDSEIEEDLFEDMELSESLSDNNDDTEEDKEEVWFKKRQRKSTHQIRMLKQELDQETSWSKEKIAELSDRTGLSQSQIYKWWWDQKKKHHKAEREALARHVHKVKPIRKDIKLRRGPGEEGRLEFDTYHLEEMPVTKMKRISSAFEETQETERKISKRLVFG